MQIYSSALFRYAYEGKKAKYLIAIIVEWNKKKIERNFNLSRSA